ncbi:hypothetical protein DFP72DRAFT_851282 [Ephemerocybe angulata]|uniref:Uncharacterized protein n=1 Tax=Ephemerocybe angulata TaxID=980116 RepID=A0A8H6HPY9_9AGAR|nr:hypothetical protein DFP72DRAFT_851282 [Tulosesus angulatus]
MQGLFANLHARRAVAIAPPELIQATGRAIAQAFLNRYERRYYLGEATAIDNLVKRGFASKEDSRTVALVVQEICDALLSCRPIRPGQTEPDVLLAFKVYLWGMLEININSQDPMDTPVGFTAFVSDLYSIGNNIIQKVRVLTMLGNSLRSMENVPIGLTAIDSIHAAEFTLMRAISMKGSHLSPPFYIQLLCHFEAAWRRAGVSDVSAEAQNFKFAMLSLYHDALAMQDGAGGNSLGIAV